MLKNNYILFTLLIFIVVAALQTAQISQLRTSTNAIGEKIAEVQVEHDAIIAEYPVLLALSS